MNEKYCLDRTATTFYCTYVNCIKIIEDYIQNNSLTKNEQKHVLDLAETLKERKKYLIDKYPNIALLVKS